MKILVFLDHDIIVRHFIMSGAFESLMAKHDLQFYVPPKDYKEGQRITLDLSTLNLGPRLRRLMPANARKDIWNKLRTAYRLRWRLNEHDTHIRKLTAARIMSPKRRFIFRLLALPLVFPMFVRRCMADLERIPYTDLEGVIAAEKPDLVIHPTVMNGEYVHDLVHLLPTFGVPLVLIMNSWDNIAGRRYFGGHPDWLLVWGSQTFDHALRLAGMPPRSVIKFGAAQFDVYNQPPRISRDRFCEIHNIDPKNLLLMYAGSSKGTDEFSHLQQLDDAIEVGELQGVKIVYRPHPWGGGGRGGERFSSHSWRHVTIERSMRGYLDGVAAGNSARSYPDYRETCDALAAIDALISPLSTIILEAALNGKPAMCLLPHGDGSEHFNSAQPLLHFYDMYKMDEFIVASGIDQLILKTRDLLARAGQPGVDARMRRAAEHFIEPFDESYAYRLLRFVEKNFHSESESLHQTQISGMRPIDHGRHG